MSVNIIISIVSWITIIVLHSLFIGDDFPKQEMVKDGNNLFSTCFTYIIMNLICKHIAIRWLQIMLCVIMITLALFPSISSTILLFNKYVPVEQKFTAMLCGIIPLIIGINCLFLYVI